MTMTTNENLIDNYIEVRDEIDNLMTRKRQIHEGLLSAQIAADEKTRQGLMDDAEEAQEAVGEVESRLSKAQAVKAALDRRVDSGDESVSPLEMTEADMAVRVAKGKMGPAKQAATMAELRAKPYVADSHLAMLVARTIEPILSVPVLVRKKARDVQGISEAVVLSQTEPTKDYGYVNASGRVQMSTIGKTDLNMTLVQEALEATGSKFDVSPSMISFEQALWDVPQLVKPSQAAVGEFGEVLGNIFRSQRTARTKENTYTYYKPRWRVSESTLEVVEPGHARGTVSSVFSIDGERPPAYQMRWFVEEALKEFDTGVHTSAGRLEAFEMTDFSDLGYKVPENEPYITERQYDIEFGCTITLDFAFEDVSG